MSLNSFKKFFPSTTLTRSNLKISGIGKQNIPIVGEVGMSFDNKIVNLLIVDLDLKYPLLGIDAMDLICPKWRNVFRNLKKVNVYNTVTNESLKDEIVKKYCTVFDKNLTLPIKNFEIGFDVKENVKPVYRKPYELPFALREQVVKELNRLVQEKIISPVKFSDWASPKASRVQMQSICLRLTKCRHDTLIQRLRST